MTESTSTTAILDLLDAERAALLERVERVPEELRTRRPTPDRWSIVEVLEHLAQVERGVTRLLVVRGRERPAAGAREAGGATVPAEARLTPERIAWLRNRAERLEAPERIRPSGTLAPAEALRQLEEVREGLRAAYAAADPAALDGQVHVHQMLGPLTLRGWVEFVAHHEARHAEQVAEIAAALAPMSI